MSDLSYRKSNYRLIWWFRVVSDLSPTLGKIGHQWFLTKKWYPWWQNQWFRLCNQWYHNSYKLFWRKNPQKILLSIFNFELNVNKCPILPLFTVAKFIVPYWGIKSTYGIGFSYRPVSLCSLTGRYDLVNFIPPVRNYLELGLGSNSRKWPSPIYVSLMHS